MLRRIERFVLTHDGFHHRDLDVGHLTGSAWVLDADWSHALLTHHRRLNLWVQMGGHVEDDETMLLAAWREAREESGLTDIGPILPEIFDVDVHAIPARPDAPAHFHYDIRFAFQTDRNARFTITEESHTLAWVALDEIPKLTQEESILRMIRKTEQMKRQRHIHQV